LIEKGEIGSIRSTLDKLATQANSGCHTMNDDLLALLKAKKVTQDDARRATTDRAKFLEMLK